ncbi:putative NmrA-like family domain-containing protein [Stipitochalara longipes BDJ]|nr:putative NmrA-like family domain-containing protein [Stipitochalara longipes BDJ]
MPRNLCITAVDGQTGHLIAELLLTDPHFSNKIDKIIGLSLDPQSPKCKELSELGVEIIHHVPGSSKKIVNSLKSGGVDAICVIPPAHTDKYEITLELVAAAKTAGVPNVCLLSSAGADLADAKKQPRLREFIEIENLVLSTKGDSNTSTGHSPVVVRAGFYMENLLVYGLQAREESTLPLPIGENHKFAPIALGDVALVVAHVLSGKGKHGFDDKHRPMLAAGNELAEAAKQALGHDMAFENISPYEAKRVLQGQATSDKSEIEYLLEYYSLVREGKTNYISTLAFHDVTGQHPQEPTEFFKVYAEEFKGEHAKKKRKTKK